jgi:translation machinery-associated protein 16
MPSTDRKLELKAKTSVAQTGLQPFVYAKRLKRSVGNRKNREHASREDIIRLTLLREEEEFNTCGLEIPDVTIPKQLEMLRNWNGEFRLLQNFKLKRFNRKDLLAVRKIRRN